MTYPRRLSPFVPRRGRRGFTFIELIVAIALSIILLRGMYTIFDSATNLTRLSEQKMGLVLETSAVFDYIAADVARVPFSGEKKFIISGNTLVFRASNRVAGEPDVYIRYQFVSGSDYGKLVRGVYTSEGCGTGYDDDGDGRNDVGMIVGRQIKSCSIQYSSGDDFDSSWSTGTTDSTRALKFTMTIGSPTPGAELKDEDFTMIFPVMSL
jgi:prepilin-type N-terminal cleavage/methylation domain-containing protein